MADKISKSDDKAIPFDHQLTGKFNFLVEIVDEDVRKLLLAAKKYSRLSMAEVSVLDDGNLLINFEFGKVVVRGKFTGADEDVG